MRSAILTLNAGSSSIKFALFDAQEEVEREPVLVGHIEGIGTRPCLIVRNGAGDAVERAELPIVRDAPHRSALACLVAWLSEHDSGRRIVAVGHRVVHGAAKFLQPVIVGEDVLDALKSYVPLAPLHQPHNVAGIEAMRAAVPGVPQVACFDTAFHRTQPLLAQLFALPRRFAVEGVRRYGFHGLSYEYIARILPAYLGARSDGKVIVAHLGNGASVCGLEGRRSQATSMGFTAVDGLMMGTRTGSLDPGVLLYLMDHYGMDARAIEALIYRESGLLGVSGISQDMRELLASSQPAAREAVDLFCYRLVREIGAIAAVLEGVDAVVFTGGIGEHAYPVRQRTCEALAWMGLDIDREANTMGATLISTPSSQVTVLVLPANEEWMIAEHTFELLANEGHPRH